MTPEKYHSTWIHDKEFRIVEYGEKPTHAVCLHGEINLRTDDSHACTWMYIVKRVKEDE